MLLFLCSLKNLCDKLSTRRMELYDISQKNQKHEYWRCSPLVVDAVWRLIHLCERDDEMQLNDLAGEFLAAVSWIVNLLSCPKTSGRPCHQG